MPHTELVLNSDIEHDWMDRARWTKLNNTLQAEIQMADSIIRSLWNATIHTAITAADQELALQIKRELKQQRDQMMSEYMMATTKDKLVGYFDTWKGQLNVVCKNICLNCVLLRECCSL